MSIGVGDQARSAGRALIRTFKDVYEFLGITIMTSLAWFVLLALAAWGLSLVKRLPLLAVPAGILLLIVLGPVTAAASSVMNKVVHRNEVGFADFISALRKYFGRGLGLVSVQGLIFAVIVSDFLFFLRFPSQFVRIASGLWVYAFLFAAAMTSFEFPLLVEQDIGILGVLKKSALLVLDNPVYSLFILVYGILITAISIVIPPAAALLFIGALGLLQNRALLQLLEKYGLWSEKRKYDFIMDDSEEEAERGDQVTGGVSGNGVSDE